MTTPLTPDPTGQFSVVTGSSVVQPELLKRVVVTVESYALPSKSVDQNRRTRDNTFESSGSRLDPIRWERDVSLIHGIPTPGFPLSDETK